MAEIICRQCRGRVPEGLCPECATVNRHPVIDTSEFSRLMLKAVRQRAALAGWNTIEGDHPEH